MRTTWLGDRADAPVLGIVLLIAFAVVLSVGMFFLYQTLTEKIEEPVLVTFTKDPAGTGGQVIVHSVGDDPVQVADLEITAVVGSCTFEDNGGVAKASGTVVAGDRWVCTQDGAVTVRHVPTNQVLFQTTL